MGPRVDTLEYPAESCNSNLMHVVQKCVVQIKRCALLCCAGLCMSWALHVRLGFCCHKEMQFLAVNADCSRISFAHHARCCLTHLEWTLGAPKSNHCAICVPCTSTK